MALGPIPVSKIKSYLSEEFGMVGDERDRALAILRSVDNEYLSFSSPTSTQDPDDEKLRDRVKATDVEGVKKMMNRLGKKPARKALAK